MAWIGCNLVTTAILASCFIFDGWTQVIFVGYALAWCALSSGLLAYLMASHVHFLAEVHASSLLSEVRF